MWNKPQLMIALSDLLLAAAVSALLLAVVIWGARQPLFPLHEVVVMNPLREVRQGEIELALSGRLRGNFFSVNLESLRQSLEQLPWVRRAEMRRQWPGRLEVKIEEHVPVAYWGQGAGQLVNAHGEVFAAVMSVQPATPLPLLSGPAGMAQETLAHFRQAEETLKPIGREPRALQVSQRLAVQVRLDDGVLVELGRQQAKTPVKERLERFVTHYQTAMTVARQKPAVVDMRYPNGFALRVSVAPVIESKGKP